MRSRATCRRRRSRFWFSCRGNLLSVRSLTILLFQDSLKERRILLDALDRPHEIRQPCLLAGESAWLKKLTDFANADCMGSQLTPILKGSHTAIGRARDEVGS